MKKGISILAAFLLTQIAVAQTFGLNIENDTAYCEREFELEYARALIINTFVESITLDIVRRELPDVRNWRTGMCVGEVCYTPDVDSVRVTLTPGEELLLRSSFSMIGIVNDTMEVIYDITNVERPQDTKAFFTYGVDVSSSVTYIDKILPAAAINIYPNPTQNFINIETDEEIESIEIYGTDGRRLLYTQENVKIPFTNLPNGQYLIYVVTDKGAVTQQVTKY